MHQYATDSNRINTLLYIGLMAGLLAWIVDPIVNKLILPWLLQALPDFLGNSLDDARIIVTAAMIVGITFPLYNGFLWRFFANQGRLSSLPNLQGYWVQVPPGTSATAAPSPETTGDGRTRFLEEYSQLIINQTWTQIAIGYVDLDEEYWQSETATLLVDEGPEPELVCTFEATSLAEPPEGFKKGTVRVRHLDSESPERLVGYRYDEDGSGLEKLAFVRHTRPHFLALSDYAPNLLDSS